LSLINQELYLTIISLHVIWSLIYLLVFSFTTIIFRNNLKKARPYHAPVQRIYVILMEITLLVVIIKI